MEATAAGGPVLCLSCAVEHGRERPGDMVQAPAPVINVDDCAGEVATVLRGELCMAHAAGVKPDGRRWEILQHGATVTATVDGLPEWGHTHLDNDAARATWRLLTALAEHDQAEHGPAENSSLAAFIDGTTDVQEQVRRTLTAADVAEAAQGWWSP